MAMTSPFAVRYEAIAPQVATTPGGPIERRHTMADPPAFDEDCDTRGQRCPLPVLKARKRLKPLARGAVLRLVSDDPLSRLDVPNFCREDGHTLLEMAEDGGTLTFFIAKA